MQKDRYNKIQKWMSQLDRDKVKEDSRKIGSALFGAVIIGFLTNNLSSLEAIVAFTISLILWFYGVKKNDNET